MPVIQPGDLILYPVGPLSRWTSRLVAWGQRMIGQNPGTTEYSHVAMVSEDPLMIYEAYWPFIRRSPIALEGNEVHRIKNVTPEQVAQMLTYCRAQLGRPYDMVSILTFGWVHIGNYQVCSELVFNAALAAGIVLYPPEYFESPDDISCSAKIERVA